MGQHFMINRLNFPVLALPAPGAFARPDRQARQSGTAAPRATTEAGPAQTATPPGATLPARYRTTRPDAAFVAQLIANAAGLPQTRARRQAAPREALAAYQNTANVVADARHGGLAA